ncbi:MAG: hypothetical protein Q8933_19245 [Bacteroidota bacterium]|nr:hypothetical protein [Bacteroidota bacterium]
MKLILKIVVLIIVLVCPLMAQSTLQLKVEIQKDTFLVGELIDVGVSVINTGTSFIHADLDGKMLIKVKDENNNEVPYVGPAGNYFSLLKQDFNPKEEDFRLFVLNSYYGIKFTPGRPETYLNPGQYTLEVTFYPPNMKQQNIKIPFRVILPEGDELIVYNTFSGLLTKPYKVNELVKMMQALYETYPNSIYQPLVLNELEALYFVWLKNSEKADFYRRELVEKYSWSGYTVDVLEGLLRKMASNSEQIEYLKKLKAKGGNSLMQKKLGKMLEAKQAESLNNVH